MLNLTIQDDDWFNEKDGTFVAAPDKVDLILEHSLVSVSKWESLTKKPFLTRGTKTSEDMKLYIEAMIISPNPPEGIVERLSQKSIQEINEYIESPESATTFGSMPTPSSRREIVTSELIYFWMITYSIPFECQYWHLNRLLTLIRVCNVKTSKPKAMSRHDLAARNRELNAKRKAELKTTG